MRIRIKFFSSVHGQIPIHGLSRGVREFPETSPRQIGDKSPKCHRQVGNFPQTSRGSFGEVRITMKFSPNAVWYKFQCRRRESEDVERAGLEAPSTATRAGTAAAKVDRQRSEGRGNRATARRDIASPSSFRTETVNNIFAFSCVTCIRFFSVRCSTIPSTLLSR